MSDTSKLDLEYLSSGKWKDFTFCPNLNLPKMDQGQIEGFLDTYAPTLEKYGVQEWGNIVDAFLYLGLDQVVFDLFAERFPLMDQALEEKGLDEKANYDQKRLGQIPNIRYFPGLSVTDTSASDGEDFSDESDDDEVDEEYKRIFEKLKNSRRSEAATSTEEMDQKSAKEERPKPTPVLQETVKAIGAAMRLLKLAEMNIHNVTIKEAKERKDFVRRYYDDYGNPCAGRSEQRIRHGIRNALCSAEKMIDLLQNVTCGEYNEWIRHTCYQHENSWMRGKTIFDHSWESPTQGRAKKAFTKIPTEAKKAEKFLDKASRKNEPESEAKE